MYNGSRTKNPGGAHSANGNQSGTPFKRPTTATSDSGGGGGNENSSGPRHIACRTCRDRKVRCDGGQPACEKCRRAGETCVYTLRSRKTKTDLQESIEMLQERLESALVTRNTDTQSGNFWPATSYYSLADSMPPKSDHLQRPSSPPELMSDSQLVGSSRLDLPNSTMIPYDSMPFATNASIDSNLNYTIPSDGPGFAGMVTTANVMDTSCPHEQLASPFIKDRSLWPSVEQRTDRGATAKPRIPSRQDVQKWNAAQQDQQQPPSTILPTQTPQTDTFARLSSLACSIGAINAHIAGIAQTLADYLAWIRKKPDECNDEILKIFEARAQEISELATSQTTTAPFSDTAGLGSQISLIKAEIARINQRKADFFQSDYKIQRSLAEQCEHLE